MRIVLSYPVEMWITGSSTGLTPPSCAKAAFWGLGVVIPGRFNQGLTSPLLPNSPAPIYQNLATATVYMSDSVYTVTLYLFVLSDKEVEYI